MQGFLATLLSAVLAALQVAAFAAMAWDKFKARTGRWRTRERDLLLLGALGPFGFVCGLVLCMHKTRKPAFLAMGIGGSRHAATGCFCGALCGPSSRVGRRGRSHRHRMRQCWPPHLGALKHTD